MTLRMQLEPLVPTKSCGARRMKTNALCEKSEGHLTGEDPEWDRFHIGRDSRGRWHSWTEITTVRP